ncbi:MAG: 5-formyltetrahydrofolate cyclo-ligase [Verrucomicrobiota bacterium]
MNSITEEKKAHRQVMLEKLAAMNPADRDNASKEIAKTLATFPEFQRAQRVAAFAPLRTEPDLLPFLFSIGKTLCFPKVKGNIMTFHEVDQPGDFVRGAYGVREPNPSIHLEVTAPEIDLILVPGLAFTQNGHRLGRGGGFYDRFLGQKAFPAPAIGICFQIQLIPELPTESFDATIDQIAAG